jgi:hypothetical protein
MATKKEIFREHLEEYLRAEKGRKSELLGAVCAVTKMHRKAAVRRFRVLQRRDPLREVKRGRSEYYTPDVTAALWDVWDAGNEVCGELLHPMIAEYVHVLKRDELWTHGTEATRKLLAMSEATVKRRVATFTKIRTKRYGLSATRPSLLKQIVPVFNGSWSDKPPGFGQVDTVLHSDSLAGDFVYTLNYTDAATCVVIPRAQWNKGQGATQESLATVKETLPFPLLGAHPDTGSEFINRLVIEWCKKEAIELSRSRPGHKNDNMYVEERNGHVVRKFIGYIRLDCIEAVDALNAVYDVLTPYLLHFIAVRRSTGKERLGSKYRRTYEKRAKTPYQRILEHPAVSDEAKEKLGQEHHTLNPLLLKREIEKRIANLYAVQKRYGAHRLHP